ncbi:MULTISPECIES: hypothetical protein [unclassified Microcoleus]
MSFGKNLIIVNSWNFQVGTIARRVRFEIQEAAKDTKWGIERIKAK